MSRKKAKGNDWQKSYIALDPSLPDEKNPYSRMYLDTERSPAFQDLTHSARWIYLDVIRESKASIYRNKYKRDNVFEFRKAKAKELGCTINTMRSALKDLESHGFIETIEKGHGNKPTTYRLSGKWKNF